MLCWSINRLRLHARRACSALMQNAARTVRGPPCARARATARCPDWPDRWMNNARLLPTLADRYLCWLLRMMHCCSGRGRSSLTHFEECVVPETTRCVSRSAACWREHVNLTHVAGISDEYGSRASYYLLQDRSKVLLLDCILYLHDDRYRSQIWRRSSLQVHASRRRHFLSTRPTAVRTVFAEYFGECYSQKA
jgi:hypothetical protein